MVCATYLFTSLSNQKSVVLADTDSGHSLTFKDVALRSKHVGQGLINSLLSSPGDVIAICSPNSSLFAVGVFGTIWAGGVVCPLNHTCTENELLGQVMASGAKVIFTASACLEKVAAVSARAGLPKSRVVVIDGEHEGFNSLGNLQKSRATVARPILKPEHDLAFLVYSSGTTGQPKGVMLTHRNMVANTMQVSHMYSPETHWRRDRCLGLLPMYHVYGLAMLVMAPLYHGVTVYVMPKFDIHRFCGTIQTDGITLSYVVPPVILALVRDSSVSDYDLSTLRMLHSSAAPLAVDLVNKAYEKLKIPIKQGYGASEAAPGISSQDWDKWDKPIGTSGHLLPMMSLKVMQDGTELPLGATGELYLRGPDIFKGYFENESATKDALDQDGWYRTGDVGFVDKNDNIFVTDRAKEMIKYNGYQVAPAELEAELLKHPAVEDAAVTGVYDPERASEVPKAYIVPTQRHQGTAELGQTIMAWIHGRVAPHKRLRGGIEFVGAIPKSGAGKILRRLLPQHIQLERTGKSSCSRL